MSNREQKALVYNIAYLNMIKFFDNYKQHICIRILPEDIAYLTKVMTERAQYKQNKMSRGSERQLSQDNSRYIERNVYGACGELAVGKYLGKEVVDTSHGNSKFHDTPDLMHLGLNLGIKTSTINMSQRSGQLPMIPSSKSTYPQIITLFDKPKLNVYILGVASVDILNKYRSDELCTFDDAYQKHKTTFVGLHKLEKLEAHLK